MGILAGYELEIDGGSWSDIGFVEPPYEIPEIFPPGLHSYRLRGYDNAIPRNVAAPSNLLSVNVPYDLDDFSATDAFWVDLNRVRADYTGPIARVTISGIPTDLATPADVATAAENDYLITRIYAQDATGRYLEPVGGTNPTLSVSAYDDKPCWKDGVMGMPAYTGWNGKAHVNVIVASRPTAEGINHLWSGGNSGLKSLYMGYNEAFLYENGTGNYVNYNKAYNRITFGNVQRYHYDGTQSSNADKLGLNVNHFERRGDADSESEVGTIASTFTNATGFYVGGLHDGTGQRGDEYFGAYIFCYNIDSQWESLKNRIGRRLFGTTIGQGFFSGDSLTESYNLNGTDPTHTYPSQVITSLESITGRDWSRLANGVIAEVASASARISFLAGVNGPKNIDDWNQDCVAVVTAGSNDLAYGCLRTAHTFTADATTNQITVSSESGWQNGVPLRLTNSGGGLPGGLSAGFDYVPFQVTTNVWKLATSVANYLAGVFVDITSAGTGTHTATTQENPQIAIDFVQALVAAWKEYGCRRVILDDLTPRTDLGSTANALFVTARDTFNDGIDTGLPDYVERIHFGLDASVQDTEDTDWYFDLVHGTLAFYTKKAQYVTARILNDLVAPIANFTMDVSNGAAPLTVSFTDISTPEATEWLWDFGDGNTSTLQNPTHEYEVAGNYDVTLTATNIVGSNESDPQTVSVTPPEMANADIPNLEARWKSTTSDITALADGANVTGWTDFAGNSHDMSVSSTGKPTKQTVGGRPVVRTAEASHVYCPIANPIGGSMFTIFVVVASAAEGVFIGSDVSGISFIQQSGLDKIFSAGMFGWLSGATTVTNGVKTIRTMRFNGTTGDLKLWYNGAADGTTNIGATTLTEPIAELLSDINGTADWADGDVYEIIVCDAALTDGQVDDVHDGLNAYHGAY